MLVFLLFGVVASLWFVWICAMCVLSCLVDGWMFRLIVFEIVIWVICIVLCKMLVVMLGWVGVLHWGLDCVCFQLCLDSWWVASLLQFGCWVWVFVC